MVIQDIKWVISDKNRNVVMCNGNVFRTMKKSVNKGFDDVLLIDSKYNAEEILKTIADTVNCFEIVPVSCKIQEIPEAFLLVMESDIFN